MVVVGGTGAREDLAAPTCGAGREMPSIPVIESDPACRGPSSRRRRLRRSIDSILFKTT